MREEPIILGIDPGSNRTGFGVIQGKTPLEYGCIEPTKKVILAKKYLEIFEGVCFLIEKHKPSILSIETQFVHKNSQSAIKLGMARGACLIAAAKYNLDVFEYAPKKIKLAATGIGSASKHQVADMIQRILSLPHPIYPEDAADALAAALCHQQARTLHKVLSYV